jgi:hypothetical protein
LELPQLKYWRAASFSLRVCILRMIYQKLTRIVKQLSIYTGWCWCQFCWHLWFNNQDIYSKA